MKHNRKKKKNKFLVLLLLVIILIATYICISMINDYINKNSAVQASNNMDGSFKELYYYDSENKYRYENYKKKNPDIAIDDVVWMVNSNIDNAFYTNVKEIGYNTTSLLLVNKYNKLPDNYVPENLVKLSSGYYVTNDTKLAFEKMKQDAKVQGYDFDAASTYRSIDGQKYIYNKYLNEDSQENVDTYSSRPGYSEHHTGEAIDLRGSTGSIEDFEQTKESKWINENSYKYGFIIRYKKGLEKITGYKYEPWHIRYVGVEVSTEMKRNNINTLEEYYEKYINNTNKK